MSETASYGEVANVRYYKLTKEGLQLGSQIFQKYLQGLTGKIGKFLFPLLIDLGLDVVAEELRKIMKDIAELYDLRSSIVHEGLTSDEENAKKNISIAQKFLTIVDHIVKSRK